MALFPRGLRMACSDLLRHFEISTVGDVITAASDTEVQEYLGSCPEDTRSAWVKLTEWALLKQEQIRDRIYDEARSGRAPTWSGSPAS